MDNIYQTNIPEGFTTVNTYLFVDDPVAYIKFLENVFDAKELSRTTRSTSGEIANCVLKIGHSNLMIAQGNPMFANMNTALYLYVDDADLVYQKALDGGCSSVFAPADMNFGDRQGGVKDPEGNYWWISKRLVEGNYEDDEL